MDPDREKKAARYRVLFFVFCAVNFIFLNAFILYFDDPYRYAPGMDFSTVMIIFAALETALTAGVLWSLLQSIRLKREAGQDAREPMVPARSGQQEEGIPAIPAVPAARPPSQNFENLLRVLLILEVVAGVLFVLFLVAVVFIAGLLMTP
jgi:hypothetical protein